jgi:hypothetical protein
MDVTALCPLAVGVVRWRAPEPSLTVVVKATYALDRDGQARLAAVQEPLRADRPDPRSGAGELARAFDFAPTKPGVDVFVVGHARAASVVRVDARSEELEPGETLELEGLLSGAPLRSVRLPVDRPRIFAARGEGPEDVALRCDTVAIDADRALCMLTWRGVVRADPEPLGLIVALESPSSPVTWASLRSRFDRATFTRAAEPPATPEPAAAVADADAEPPTNRPLQRSAAAALAERSEVPAKGRGFGMGVTLRRAPPAEPPPEPVPEATVPPEPAPPPEPARRVLKRKQTMVLEGEAAREVLPFAPPAAASPDAGLLRSGRTLTFPASAVPQGPALPFKTPAAAVLPFKRHQTFVGDEVPALPVLPFQAPGPGVPAAPDHDGGAPLGVPRSGPGGPAPPAPAPPSPPNPPPVKVQRANRWDDQTGVIDLAALSPALPFQGAGAAPRAEEAATIGMRLAQASPANLVPAPSVTMEPEIPLALYAAIQAEIWEARAPLDEILERHGIDEPSFRIARGLQAEALAREAGEGRSTLARELDVALRSRALAPVAGDALGLDDYAVLQAAIDAGGRPSEVLAWRGLTAAAWQRARRHWRSRAAADARARAELRERLSAARRAAERSE